MIIKEDDEQQVQQPKREFTGVFIPVAIWEHPELNWTEKCLLAEIHAIGGHRGNCFASNEYLAGKMDVSQVRVRSMISHLKELRLVRQVSFDGRVRKLKTLFDSDEVEQADRLKTSGRGDQIRAGGGIKSERAPIGKSKEKIQNEVKTESAPPAQRTERGPVVLDADGDPKQETLAELEAPAPPSKFKAFVELWSQSYEAHVGAPYPFQGGRDGKAAKALTSNCRTATELVELAAWCWGNLTGYVQQQCLTIHGFAAQQAVVQGMRAQREGKFKKDVLTPAQRAANVKAGDAWKNDLADW